MSTKKAENDGLIVRWETITPERAKLDRERSANFRHLNRARGALYARVMAAGEWRENGDAIRYDENGACIDGQHRLYGCEVSGVPLRTLCVYGVSDRAQATIDTGRARQAGDWLASLGVKYPNTVASAVGRALSCSRGKTTKGLIAIGYGANNAMRPTHGEIIDYYERHAAVVDECVAISIPLQRLIPPGQFAGFCLVARGIRPEEVVPFADGVRDPSRLPSDDPRALLRVRLMDERRGDGGAGRGRASIVGMIVRAWNAHIAGKRMVKLYAYKKGSDQIVEFDPAPQPIE